MDLVGITVAAPLLCERGEAYLRVERAVGSRKLGTGREGSGGFREGCTRLPADPKDGSCPVIDAGTLLTAATAELRKRNIEIVGQGLGPCGEIKGDYAAWNMSIGVHAWSEAEPAVRVVAELLERYDLAGYTGVAVRGIQCAVLL
ncbi:MAG: hypothetical protein JWP01_486 [Myxococcales bacterium]|nr:hypothetical protein [Myxococcales bacterium]